MSINSVLRGCHEVLCDASALLDEGCPSHAARCSLQAEAVARLLAELETSHEEETSDD